MTYNPNKEFDVYSEESDEELGIDYLENSFEETERDSQEVQEVTSPINRTSSRSSEIPKRQASPEVISRYAPMGVSSIIFNMVDGSCYELIINKRR